jgi:hypothetical protein
MKTVRRLYFYAVSLISLELVLWGLVSLLRSIFNPKLITDRPQTLAQALALILVGVPIFLIHWLWAQRVSGRDEEEKTASLRALFLYGALFATLIPAVLNFLSLIDHQLLKATQLRLERAVFGGSQTLSDNLIAIVMNLLIAAYFWSVLRGEWRSLPNQGNFKDIRRLYRHVWVLYGLLMVIFGAQQVLRYIFYIPTQAIGPIGRETLINGIALLIIGTPIWVYIWRICQGALREAEDKESLLRLGVLYLLSLAGVITVLSAGGSLLDTLLNRLFGDLISTPDLVERVGGQLSLIIPFGAIWAYYGGWLSRQIQMDEQPVRQAGKKRLYYYILSFIGLVAAFIGVALLIKLIIDVATGLNIVGANVVRARLCAAIATILVALPLWILTWRPMQTESMATGDMGDHARRSLVRKTYLYLTLFASVIGGMSSAVRLVFMLINAALGGSVGTPFLAGVLNFLQLLVLFVVVLIYHLSALRRDGVSMTSALEAKHAAFHVLVFDQDGKFGEAMKAVLTRQAPKLPVTILKPTEKVTSSVKAEAVILPGSLAVNTPEPLETWLRGYGGSKMVVPDDAPGISWANNMTQAAQYARNLAEGGELRLLSSKGSSAWRIVIYIFAALFAIELFFVLLSLAISTLIGPT